MATREIERVPLPTRKEFYKRWGNPREPVVFVGAMESWPALKQWSFDWFKQKHGDVPVFVNTGRYDQNMTLKNSSISEYVDSLFDPNASYGYLSNIKLLDIIPSLTHDVHFPEYTWMKPFIMRNFWMSRKGQITQLHCDYGHNIIGQVVGSKRFELYTPKVSNQLYPVNQGWAGCFSRLDYQDCPPEIRAERGKILPDYDVTIRPGEMLYLPFGWWHRVFTEEEAAIMVNLWWWTPEMLLDKGPVMARELGGKFVEKRFSRGKAKTA
jgi:Cupin-like domain